MTSPPPIAVPLRRTRDPRHDAVDSATACATTEGIGGRGGGGRPASAVAVAGVQVRWARGRPVVVLPGDVDLASAPQIASVGPFLRRWGRPACVDAAGVGFMDVAGLRAVLGLAGASGAVEVRHPSWAVLHLLQVLGAAGAGVQLSRALGPHPAVVLHEPPVLGWGLRRGGSDPLRPPRLQRLSDHPSAGSAPDHRSASRRPLLVLRGRRRAPR